MKIIKVKSCKYQSIGSSYTYCQFFSDSKDGTGVCFHPQLEHYARVKEPDNIPPWCPLEDER
jgi:hypothetical protein